jgi:AcrR family transcriptional regulator
VAIDRFAAQGFQATGIRDIAEHAGISVATLYHYMHNKQELLEDIMRESLLRLCANADAVLKEVSTPVDQVAGLTVLHVLTHGLEQNRTLVVDTELRSLGPDARARVVSLRDEYERRWGDALSNLQNSAQVTAPNLGITRLSILNMLTGVASWYDRSGTTDLDDIARLHVDLVLAMLGAATQDGAEVRFRDCTLPELQWFHQLIDRASDRSDG